MSNGRHGVGTLMRGLYSLPIPDQEVVDALEVPPEIGVCVAPAYFGFRLFDLSEGGGSQLVEFETLPLCQVLIVVVRLRQGGQVLALEVVSV